MTKKKKAAPVKKTKPAPAAKAHATKAERDETPVRVVVRDLATEHARELVIEIDAGDDLGLFPAAMDAALIEAVKAGEGDTLRVVCAVPKAEIVEWLAAYRDEDMPQPQFAQVVQAMREAIAS